MANFSDSPGAIYPALRRLEERKLVRSNIEQGSGLRRRKVLQLTPLGLSELTKWLTAPLSQADVASRLNEIMLRFAFLDTVLGPVATLKFLLSLQTELGAYIPQLKKYLKNHALKMPTSGRLALESGVLGYKAQLAWVSHAIAAYRKEVNQNETTD